MCQTCWLKFIKTFPTRYPPRYFHKPRDLMDDQSRIARIRVGNNFGDTAGNTMYLMEDHLGSITMRATTTGSITDREEYYPFGDSSLRTWAKKRYRYTGKEKDEESGLYYYGARYYAAWTCRFISVDPLAGKYSNVSPYCYAHNKPINKVDVNGEGPSGEGQDGAKPPPQTDSGGATNNTTCEGRNDNSRCTKRRYHV